MFYCKDCRIAGMLYTCLATEAGQYCNVGYLYSIRYILLVQNTIIFWLYSTVYKSNLLLYIYPQPGYTPQPGYFLLYYTSSGSIQHITTILYRIPSKRRSNYFSYISNSKESNFIRLLYSYNIYSTSVYITSMF
jgi:hypothetical protein